MTERRPAHESVPDFVERQIRAAQERGAFDALPGAGEPLEGLDRPHDDLWWVKRTLRDENITELPPALRARRDRDRSLAAALEAPTEQAVRRVVEAVNQRIRRINRTNVDGPPTATGPLDVDEVVARWRVAHPDRVSAPADAVADVSRRDPGGGAGQDGARRGWLSRVAMWVGHRSRRR